MLVRDLVEEPLSLRLLHGDAAALGRAVVRACVTDMPDPTPFVTPGALVCTGLVWRRGPDDSDRYIGLLARAGAVAVAAGQSLHGHVPADVVAACARHGLPLLAAPETTPFSGIIEYLAGRHADLRVRRAKSGLARQRRLLAAVADGQDIHQLVAEFARDCGVSVWLLTATGMEVAGTSPLSETEIDAVVAAAASAPRLPLALPGGYRVWPVGGRLGDRISRWYLVIRDTSGADEQDEFGADLAAVTELYRMRHVERLRLRWEMADLVPAEPASDEVVAVFEAAESLGASGRPPADPTAGIGRPDLASERGAPMRGRSTRLVQPGIRTAPVRSAEPMGSAPGRVGAPDRGAAGSRRWAEFVETDPIDSVAPSFGYVRRGESAVVSRDALRVLAHDVLPGCRTDVDREGRIVAWMPGTEQDIAAALRGRLARLAPVLRGARLRVGVSACRSGESPSGAAASAVAAAVATDDEPVGVRVADVDSAVGLFTTIPDQLQRRFAERVLGPVVDYDRRTGAGLLRTLEVFLGCAGSWRQAADRMHLHLNTVRYRIGRIEELTGRDLGRLDDRLDLYLAVQACSRPGSFLD
ncbi:helix-turn-helix domain-containing protein [Nocardia transvalensis]|uniref:helix-turn-helix domain-containing protein n=1 Tax=Nocardia transvalensis TaxID=37333 RepID=UPI00189546D9|nr:PucR family transcriptional regulator [Nocardia transvalensis]MBF6332891.1 helix-turn-helix domain-containing protein [Nocardia transvalensis]